MNKSAENDITFLKKLRDNIDKYLFLGHAPSVGSPGHDPDVDKMEQALKTPEFQELRTRIVKAKARATTIMSRFNIKAIFVQHPPPAISGRAPIIEQHLLDMVTENRTWERVPKTRIFDAIDEAIGALKAKAKNTSDVRIDLDKKRTT